MMMMLYLFLLVYMTSLPFYCHGKGLSYWHTF